MRLLLLHVRSAGLNSNRREIWEVLTGRMQSSDATTAKSSASAAAAETTHLVIVVVSN